MIESLFHVKVESFYSGRRCPEEEFYTNAPTTLIEELEEKTDYCRNKIIKILKEKGFKVYENAGYMVISSRS